MDAQTVVVGFLAGVGGALVVRELTKEKQGSSPQLGGFKAPALLSPTGSFFKAGEKQRLGYI